MYTLKIMYLHFKITKWIMGYPTLTNANMYFISKQLHLFPHKKTNISISENTVFDYYSFNHAIARDLTCKPLTWKNLVMCDRIIITCCLIFEMHKLYQSLRHLMAVMACSNPPSNTCECDYYNSIWMEIHLCLALIIICVRVHHIYEHS